MGSLFIARYLTENIKEYEHRLKIAYIIKDKVTD
jgi:hypothetical protein